ncbi:hypothetical protein GNF80_16590 [Clostridium perfringens]|nr:hypothetical protein [Clostridium perfringens]
MFMNILKYLLFLHSFMIRVQKNIEIIKYYEKRYEISLDEIVVVDYYKFKK